MSEETARCALNIAFDSPSNRIKIEFQGGEPLLNFPLISNIVAAAKKQAATLGKAVQFVIALNLALLDDTVLGFCKANDVLLSTSL
jgi:sulfatase maturation enzyme AslB (radical SAM superfamily)